MLRVAQLTPPGRGAVASLAVEGPGAVAAVQRRLRLASGQPLGDLPPARVALGRFGPGGAAGEEVVVRRRSDEAVDIHCHGGWAAVAQIEELLVADGARLISWQEWTTQDAPDPLATAAAVALADARTERTALILLDQHQGALRRAVEEAQRALASDDLNAARRQVDALLARADCGLHLTTPWRVALVGPPNVGKSSLINALVGYQRAIVAPEAGTTRDVVGAATSIEGWPVELLDTAGLRRAENPLEEAGVALARRQAAAADLVLLVFDASAPWTATETGLHAAYPGALMVHNKTDLAPLDDAVRPQGVWTSAQTGEGLAGLVAAIAARLVTAPPPPGAAVPFAAVQVEQLARASQALVRGEADEASGSLTAMLRGME